MVREVDVFTSTAGKPTFGMSYFVTAYEVGAQVASGSAGNTISVRAGHGFEANDKGIVFEEGTAARYFQVGSVDSVTLTLAGGQTLSVAAGEYLVNLGADTGFTAPNYDGSGAVIYTDMDYANVATYSTVQTTSDGRARYFHRGIPRWDLVRSDAETPFALFLDSGGVTGEDPVAYEIRYAHLFATSGTGTVADPWPGQAIMDAWADLPAGVSGKVKMVGGVFDLGSAAVGLDLDYDGNYTTGFVLEGSGGGNEETGTVGPTYANDGGTMLLYSGSGEAIRIGSFSTANSQWLENSVLRGFKVRQTGTAGTGIGILARLFRWGLFEDVNVVDFAVGVGLASVSDFNMFNKFRSRDCQTYHVDVGRTTDAAGNALGGTAGQCNGNRFVNCDIMNSVRDTAYTNWGIRVNTNCVLGTISDSEFHNFDTSTYGAIKIDDNTTDSSNWTVDRCYFEGNYVGVYHNNPFGGGAQNHQSITVTNSYFAQIEQYGVWINSGGAGGITDGVVVTGNKFDVPSSSVPYSTAIGIQLGTYVQNAVIQGNSFSILTVVGTLPGGNVKIASSTVTQNNLILGTKRVTGAVTFDSTLAVTSHATVSGQIRRSVTAGITASTTQTQVGGTALTADVNEVSTCVNASDTVTLPTAVAGMMVVVINNGAQTLKIYPASGDNLGNGADAARASNLAAGSNVTFISYNATNWEEI